MDDRDGLVTSEGFDWLYGEDAAGAVVEEPPAIGSVTEPGFDASPLATDEVEEPVVEEPVIEEPAFDDEPFETEASAEAIVEPEGFDLSELDASFGPPAATVMPEQSAPVPVAQKVATPPPPPPPPVSSPQIEPVATAPTEERTVAEIYQGGDVEEVAETTVMQAVSSNTAQIPVASSRGDIIAAGTRKMSLRDRLTPVARPQTRPTSTSGDGSDLPKSTKAIASVMVAVLSLGISAWRFDGLRELVFGNGAPSEEQVDAAFTPLKGHTYTKVPESLMEQTRQITDPMMPKEIEHYDLRLLGQPQNPDGMVMIFSIDPDLATPERWDLELQHMPPTNIGPIKEIKFAGVDAISATPPNSQGAGVVMFADPEGLMFFVMARTVPSAQAIGKQLAKANL